MGACGGLVINLAAETQGAAVDMGDPTNWSFIKLNSHENYRALLFSFLISVAVGFLLLCSEDDHQI